MLKSRDLLCVVLITLITIFIYDLLIHRLFNRNRDNLRYEGIL